MKTITVTSETNNKPKRQLPLNLGDLGIFLVLAIALIVAAFFILRPMQQIDEVADSRRKSDIGKIYDGITLYLIDKGGELPLYDVDKDLPEVSSTNILEAGIDLERVNTLLPEYIVNLPKDPNGASYKIGVLNNGRVAVATRLSTGEIYLVSQSNSSIPLPDPTAEESNESNSNPSGGVPFVEEDGQSAEETTN